MILQLLIPKLDFLMQLVHEFITFLSCLSQFVNPVLHGITADLPVATVLGADSSLDPATFSAVTVKS